MAQTFYGIECLSGGFWPFFLFHCAVDLIQWHCRVPKEKEQATERVQEDAKHWGPLAIEFLHLELARGLGKVIQGGVHPNIVRLQ